MIEVFVIVPKLTSFLSHSKKLVTPGESPRRIVTPGVHDLFVVFRSFLLLGSARDPSYVCRVKGGLSRKTVSLS